MLGMERGTELVVPKIPFITGSEKRSYPPGFVSKHIFVKLQIGI